MDFFPYPKETKGELDYGRSAQHPPQRELMHQISDAYSYPVRHHWSAQAPLTCTIGARAYR
jgi:hypothetical protein